MVLNKEKRHIALVRNFVIVLTLLGSVIGLLYLNRQRLKTRLSNNKCWMKSIKPKLKPGKQKRN
jgi:hypothetical protein